MPRLSYLTLLLLLSCASAALVRAQGASEAQARLAKQGRVFDLSSEEKRRETIADFIDAVGDGEQKTVELYLAAGVDINARDEFEQTALFMATVERKYTLALLLLDKGADPNLARDDRLTPLPVAIQRDFSSSRGALSRRRHGFDSRTGRHTFPGSSQQLRRDGKTQKFVRHRACQRLFAQQVQ